MKAQAPQRQCHQIEIEKYPRANRQEQVELLQLDASGIHVAEYLTELPERQLLHERLQRAIDAAQKKYVVKSNNDHSVEPKK